LIRLAFSPSAAAGFSEHVQFASVSYSMEGGD
jgi:hypothetical protein